MVEIDKIVLNVLEDIASRDKYQTVDLTDALRVLSHKGVESVEAMRILARLKHDKVIGGEVIGHNFILILNP